MCSILRTRTREAPSLPEMQNDRVMHFMRKMYQNQMYVMANIETSESQKKFRESMDTRRVVRAASTNEQDWITGSTQLSAVRD